MVSSAAAPQLGDLRPAGEPIHCKYATPWGIRFDGNALLAARPYGWIELGFHNDFFAELLDRSGLPGGWRSQVGTKPNGRLHIKARWDSTARFFGLSGPGLPLGTGNYDAEVSIVARDAGDLVALDVCCDGGGRILATRICSATEFAGDALGIDFTLATSGDVEMRLFIPGGFVGIMEKVTLRGIG